jgi:hypothetical protein
MLWFYDAVALLFQRLYQLHWYFLWQPKGYTLPSISHCRPSPLRKNPRLFWREIETDKPWGTVVSRQSHPPPPALPPLDPLLRHKGLTTRYFGMSTNLPGNSLKFLGTSQSNSACRLGSLRVVWQIGYCIRFFFRVWFSVSLCRTLAR